MEEASALATKVGILAKRMLGMALQCVSNNHFIDYNTSYWDYR